MRRPRCVGRREERGVTLVLFALLVTALFVISALVIDLSFVRQNRQADKGAADFAVAAGIRAMDGGGGNIDVWGGICTAVDYLKVNHQELSDLASIGPDPCVPPVPIVYCEDPGDWGEYVGLADGGNIHITIAAGYDLAASDFSEDDAEYSGDDGDDPCEHLAVIIRQQQDPFFGDVAGSSGWETTMRSVARLDVGTEGLSTAALVLLERSSCKALEVDGSEARVLVAGNGRSPGLIHADSDGTGCGFDERIIDVETNGAAVPSVVAEVAEVADPPATEPLPGQVLSFALEDNPGSEATLVASDPQHKVCAQLTSTDCLTKDPASGALPTPNDLVRRTPIDTRYLSRMRQIEELASENFTWSAAQAIAATSPIDGVTPLFDVVYSDDHPDPAYWCSLMPAVVTAANVWTDCDTVADVNRSFTGTGRVVIAAALSNDNVAVTFPNVSQLFIEGTLSSAGDVLVNHGTSSSCADRHSASSSARTEMVVGGSLITTGGTLRMCQTTLLMSHDDGSCPIPGSAGTEPRDNTCIGKIDTTGQSALDWSAPNSNVATSPSDAELANLEDLAFWTETSVGLKIEGQGGITMAGIFVTPNAAPFRIAGQGTKDTTDAQFFTRRLQVAGKGNLVMRPDPQNSAPIKIIGGFTLVR